MNDSRTADELPTKNIWFVGEAAHRRNHKCSNFSESRRIVRKCRFLTHAKYSDYARKWFTDCRRIADKNYFICGRDCTQAQPYINFLHGLHIFITDEIFWLCSWMIHRLPTNCRRKLFHLWARLDKDTTINEVTPLNRTELCESVVLLHRQSILKHMNDSPTADELPTKIISFVGEAAHRLNHKWSNFSEPRRFVRKFSFLTQAKYSDYTHEWFTDCRRIADKNYFICGRGCTQTQP